MIPQGTEISGNGYTFICSGVSGNGETEWRLEVPHAHIVYTYDEVLQITNNVSPVRSWVENAIFNAIAWGIVLLLITLALAGFYGASWILYQVFDGIF